MDDPSALSRSVVDPDLLEALVAAELAKAPTDTPQRRQLSKVSLAALLAGNAGDALSTIYAVNRGRREANPVYGERPSVGKVLAVKGAGTLAQLLGLGLAAKSHPKAANLAAKIGAGALGAVTIHNLRQGRK